MGIFVFWEGSPTDHFSLSSVFMFKLRNRWGPPNTHVFLYLKYCVKLIFLVLLLYFYRFEEVRSQKYYFMGALLLRRNKRELNLINYRCIIWFLPFYLTNFNGFKHKNLNLIICMGAPSAAFAPEFEYKSIYHCIVRDN